jgi:hypothetical protein
MSFLNTSEPLGLPKGSVRALIALMVVTSFCYRFVVGLPVDAALATIAGSVFTWYFVTRGQKDDEPVAERLPAPAIGD